MTLDQDQPTRLEDTLSELLRFPLIDSLLGRRSRRFCMGAEIPDGVFAFKSKHKLYRCLLAAVLLHFDSVAVVKEIEVC